MRLSKIAKHEIKRARLLIQSGDRAGALRLLRGLEGLEVTGEGVDGTFRCDRLNIEAIRIRECLWRRSRTWVSGAARGTGRHHPIASGCVGCPIGAAFAKQFSDFEPPKQGPMPEVTVYAKRLKSSFPREVDPLTMAADLTPDDVFSGALDAPA